MYAERAILALELELTVLAMVEAWKPLQAEATESGVVARADQHRPVRQRKNRWGKKAYLQKRYLSNQKFPARECWQASVMGWHRHDE